MEFLMKNKNLEEKPANKAILNKVKNFKRRISGDSIKQDSSNSLDNEINFEHCRKTCTKENSSALDIVKEASPYVDSDVDQKSDLNDSVILFSSGDFLNISPKKIREEKKKEILSEEVLNVENIDPSSLSECSENQELFSSSKDNIFDDLKKQDFFPEIENLSRFKENPESLTKKENAKAVKEKVITIQPLSPKRTSSLKVFSEQSFDIKPLNNNLLQGSVIDSEDSVLSEKNIR
ncbi:hypothetical protein HK099_001175 [Clydaea vesicula]|uniref:Uncharacterized protein n=1 Tax=Clydaea vesicula TaxID=447962 RepID=A0AAD5XW48_9FUNG|nr:hypothetical protein HK099_001175 [Clydaea vesicula]